LPVAIVDDDAAVRVALVDLFEASGTACNSFESAEALLLAAPYCEFSCLVLDLDLPGRSGLELQELLAVRRPFLPIVFLTAHDQPHWRRLAVERGARAFLVKPVDGEQVLACVRTCMQDSGSRS
jgi:FixJ family two-component response regulator